MHSRIMW